MTVTKKDYILIAASLKSAHDIIPATIDGHHAVYRAAEHVADALQRDNPRFDFSRFMTACGVVSWIPIHLYGHQKVGQSLR